MLVQERFADVFGYPPFLIWLDILFTANVIIRSLVVSHRQVCSLE